MNRTLLIKVPAAILLLVILAGGIYFSNYYHTSDYVDEYLEGDETVAVRTIPQGLLLDGPGDRSAMIFYPGAKVEYTAYAPLLHALAAHGTDCFLVKMPLNFALLGVGKASGIMKKHPYEKWYLCGHSLGGVAASMYAAENDLDGLILLASYPTKALDERTLELYGSRDGVLNLSKREESEHFLPEGSAVHVIEGGNHAYFGDYGDQDGDRGAAISRSEQQEMTVKEIEAFLQ